MNDQNNFNSKCNRDQNDIENDETSQVTPYITNEIFEGLVSNSDSTDSDNNCEGDDLITLKQSSADDSPRKFLSCWSFKNNITHTALTEFLSWFSTKPDLSGLPICARTLLKTPVSVDIEKQGSGEFYFGINKTLTKIAEKYFN